MAHALQHDSGPSPDWNRTAADYATHRAGPPLSFYRRLAALGVGQPGQRILDLGTGTGLLALQFARQGVHTAGLDPVEGMLDQGRAIAKKEGLAVDFRVGRAEAPPFPDGSFDAITANHCWFYFDSAKVIAQAKRLLAPGGPVVISFFAWLAIADLVVKATEDLIFRYNPSAPDLGWNGIVPTSMPWAKEIATQTAMFWYDEPIPYSHAGWRGRVRANRAIGGGLPPEQVAQADAEMGTILQQMVPDPFTVIHRISAHFVVPK